MAGRIRDETEAAIAEAIAKLHAENNLAEAVAELLGLVDALLNLLGGNDSGGNNAALKLFEASETETVRKVRVQGKPQRRTRQPKVLSQPPAQS